MRSGTVKSGSDGESIFTYPPSWVVNVAGAIKSGEVAQEAFTPIRDLHDDRLLVLVGAMFVENAVDDLLEAFVPDRAGLDRLTLGVRINLVRSLRLCPDHFLVAAANVNALRTVFAHELAAHSFSALTEPKHAALLATMRRLAAEILYSGPDQRLEEDREEFQMLVVVTVSSLAKYALCVRRLREFLLSDQFLPSLARFLGHEGSL